jgi:CO/xanthine dehydrogenase FAD-binding subunit
VLLPEFEFHEPTTVSEACEIMGRLREKARPLAGGTDLIVNMKKKLIQPDHVVSLARIDDLKSIDREDGILRIGACVTAAELADSEVINKTLGALAQGARVLGSPLVRNLATIAGNLVSARPAADLPPPLMAYGARAVLVKTSGERSVDLSDFFEAPGKTVMEPDEILTRILIEIPQGRYGDSYIKLGVRQTLEISLVNVAAFVSLDDPDGPITHARIVLGSVGPAPIRALSAEDVLGGQLPTEALFARAGEAAAGDAQPIDDFRGSAEYRRDMVGVLTRRALNAALDRATSR